MADLHQLELLGLWGLQQASFYQSRSSPHLFLLLRQQREDGQRNNIHRKTFQAEQVKTTGSRQQPTRLNEGV